MRVFLAALAETALATRRAALAAIPNLTAKLRDGTKGLSSHVSFDD
jgi:hypothetical protein